MSEIKKTKFNFSEELADILQSAYSSAKIMKLTSITLENFLYHLVDYYFNEKAREGVTYNNVLLSVFSKISLEDKLMLVDHLQEVFHDTCTQNNLSNEFYDDSSYVLDWSLEQVIDETNARNSKLFPDRNGVIEADILLMTILQHKEYTSLFSQYGITAESISKEISNTPVATATPTASPKTDSESLLEEAEKLLEKFSEKGENGETIVRDHDKFLNNLLNNTTNQDQSAPNEQDENFEKWGQHEAITLGSADPNSTTPQLDIYSFDMTKAAKNGKYDPVVGRDKEIDSMIEDLCRRKKRNVVLLGDAGVGKTSIVEGFAQRIILGKVPRELQGKRVCSLNLNNLVAGTKYRGDYEQRLKEIIDEVIANPNIIIYIDEIHNLVGNGGSAGNGDGANILKPYLARGEFQCIGSTTVGEYRKFVEKDAALKRRFSEIIVQEPTKDETVAMLKAIMPKYEEYHRVRCSLDVIKACVDWSGRYMTDRYFPDKAIDCLDKACSFVKIGKIHDTKKQDELRERLDEVIAAKIKAVQEDYDFEEGEKLQAQAKSIEAEINKEVKKLEKEESSKKNWPALTIDNIADAVSKLSRVPVSIISHTDGERIRMMKNELEKKVIGQQEAIDSIIKSLQRNFLGLRDETKPIATSLFVGPTGTGKTLICKEIARIFFGSIDNLIRIDGNELKHDHEVSKLTGATAGYIGYDDEPLLLQVKRKPYSLLLIDEIEKAAPGIYDIFMNILDEGYCTLADGTRVDFKNTIIIFTGNIGTKELHLEGDGIGFDRATGDAKQKKNETIVMKAIKKQFRPEFINRLSNITVFNELGKPELDKIFNLELGKIKDKISKKKVSIKVTPKMKTHIIELCDVKMGARDMQRNITANIVDPIGEAILNMDSSKFTIDYDEGIEKPVVTTE